MDTLFLTSSKDNDFFDDEYIIASVDGILEYSPANSFSSEYITLEEAKNKIKSAGYNENFDFKRLKNFNPEAQQIYDWTKKTPRQIENYCSSCFDIGANPLPFLRKLLGDKIIIYSTTNKFNFEKNKHCVFIFHNVNTNLVNIKVYA